MGIGRSIRAKKLTSRFMGSFEVLERIRLVAYRIALPSQLSFTIHYIFHGSQLKKYQLDLSHIIEPEEVELQENMTYKAKPKQIVDVEDKQLRNKIILLMKISVEERHCEVEYVSMVMSFLTVPHIIVRDGYAAVHGT
ncbi:uncharacterized protein LOC129308864 [Prosopis cineraria]|uniref:uncharacterized protein LOC129308864 n=1 Tax=Prosopis cineraria TaxID=364024 RepID=UPI00240F5A1F|nr:uncharacterized protein LOC129308864 [Prosopis cineraria]